MATKTKKAEAVADEATGLELARSFEFTVPGREVVEQINLQIPSEYGGARSAAVAAFHALYDGGSNSPTKVTVELGDDSISVTVTQHPYVHG